MRSSKRLYKLLEKISSKNIVTRAKPTDEIRRQFIPIGLNNRVTHIWKTDSKGTTSEVTCVSLDIKINNEWETIVYYDSHHEGKLHRHTRISYLDRADITDWYGVKSKGSQQNLLTWSIEDLKHKYLYYKKQFLKRNKKNLEGLEIDLY